MTHHAEYFQAIQKFLQEAGDYALERQQGVLGHEKHDKSLVTETDLAISKMAQERLKPFLSLKGHILLDEESILSVGKPSDVFAQTEYQWVLDPIDGTVPYANGMDNFGILLGLLHKGQPLLGGIYMPAKNLMLLADESSAYRRTTDGLVKLTPRQSTPIGKQSLVQISNLRFEAAYLKKKGYAWTLSGGSAVEQWSQTILGQSSATYGRGAMSIWDVAASSVIAQRLGMDLRWRETDANVLPFKAEDLHNNWKLNKTYMLTQPHNTQRLRDIAREADEQIGSMEK